MVPLFFIRPCLPIPSAFYPTPTCFHNVIYKLLPNRNLCMCGKHRHITTWPNQHLLRVSQSLWANLPNKNVVWTIRLFSFPFILSNPGTFRQVIVLRDEGVDRFTVGESSLCGVECLLTHGCLQTISFGAFMSLHRSFLYTWRNCFPVFQSSLQWSQQQ